MNISWVIAPEFKIEFEIREVGPVWGSDIAARYFDIDNVVCFDYPRAANLISRNFQRTCNFYIPQGFYKDLGRPPSVNLVGGDFSSEVSQKEELVSLHLVKDTSDIVLLGGLDLSLDEEESDKDIIHKKGNFLNSVHRLVKSSENVQWVVVDNATKIDERFANLSNITQDSAENIISYFS